jgi:hypothetical protein
MSILDEPLAAHGDSMEDAAEDPARAAKVEYS